MTRALRSPRAFLSDSHGVSAVEFAFVTPLLLLLLLAGVDCGRLVYASERMEAVANQVAEMIAQTSQNPAAARSGDGLIASGDIVAFYKSAPFIFPEVLAQAQRQNTSWSQLLKLDLTSVSFTPVPAGCTSSCAYAPKVMWTYGDADYLRACDVTLTGAPDKSPSSPTTLPVDSFGPNSLLVVDVHYLWTPTFGADYFGSVTLGRSIYLNPRYVPAIEATGGNGVTICP